MTDRLSPLAIVPSELKHSEVLVRPSARQWQPSADSPSTLPSRLFWCDPPWHRYENSLADMIAIAVANLGVTVAATQSDLSSDSSPTRFHDGPIARSRMLPYRPERFGVSRADFESVSAIDLRLLPERDPSGAPFYGVDKVSHFGAMDSDETSRRPQSLPSLTLPPDVEGIHQLQPKFAQLRSLSPRAAVFISILPHRIDADLPLIVSQGPDGIILRCDDPSMDGLELLRVVCESIKIIDAVDANLPVLLAPGAITANDAIKWLRVGASALAIDHWCDEMLDGIDDALAQSAISHSINQQAIDQIAKQHLSYRMERLAASEGSHQACTLSATDDAWKEVLAITG